MRVAKFLCGAALGLLGLLGCIKRTERITVFEDGAAILQTTIEGDAWDLREGDALPEVAARWTVQEQSEVDKDGDEKLTRVAERRLATDTPWPETYAVAGGELEGLALRFPTTLMIERRAEGVYYHFRRVYQGRDHARGEYEARQVMETDEMKQLSQKKPEELTTEERGRMADAALQAHVRKIAAGIDATIEEFHGQIPQDTLLIMRRNALTVLESPELVQRIHRMIVDQEEDQDFEGLEQQLAQQIRDTMAVSLRDAGVRPGVVADVLDAAERVRRTRDITQDLGDEEWMVTLQMPGRVIAHNSFDPLMGGTLKNKTGIEDLNAKAVDLVISTDDGRAFPIHSEPFQVGWRFKGDALFDRDVVLMATSFVPKEE